ncbi:MAG: hypothetical protein QXE79_04645 [Candidatus Bathyarchaeia archaeon]
MKEMKRRVEHKREILQRREQHKKLAKALLEGRHYHEPLTVKGLDGEYYEVDVYAMTDGEFRELVAKAGLRREDLEEPERLIEHLNLQRNIAAKCIRGAGGETYAPEELSRLLMPLEYSRIFRKVLEISGVIPSTLSEAVGTFREE